MIHNSFSFTGNLDFVLAQLSFAVAGPLITVEIAVPQALVDIFTNSGQTLPSPHTGLALIDSGASLTCFDDDLIQSLQVSPTGIADVLGPTGSKKQNTYPLRLRVPNHRIDVELTTVIGADLKNQKTPSGQPIIGLLGRDFLLNCIFIYNGIAGMYTLGTNLS